MGDADAFDWGNYIIPSIIADFFFKYSFITHIIHLHCAHMPLCAYQCIPIPLTLRWFALCEPPYTQERLLLW